MSRRSETRSSTRYIPALILHELNLELHTYQPHNPMAYYDSRSHVYPPLSLLKEAPWEENIRIRKNGDSHRNISCCEPTRHVRAAEGRRHLFPSEMRRVTKSIEPIHNVSCGPESFFLSLFWVVRVLLCHDIFGVYEVRLDIMFVRRPRIAPDEKTEWQREADIW